MIDELYKRAIDLLGPAGKLSISGPVRTQDGLQTHLSWTRTGQPGVRVALAHGLAEGLRKVLYLEEGLVDAACAWCGDAFVGDPEEEADRREEGYICTACSSGDEP